MRAKTYRKANGVTRIVRGKYVGGSTRSEEWKATTASVKERDGYCCTKCGRTKAQLNKLGIQLQVNHIRMLARGGTDSKLNLRSECDECHAKNFKHDHIRKRKALKKNAARAKKSRFYEITKGKKL